MRLIKKIITFIIVVTLIIGCSNKEIFDNQSDFYDSMSNISWRSGMAYDDDNDDLIFIDIERQEIFHLDMNNYKIVSLGTTVFIDGKKPIEDNQVSNKYVETIKDGLIFRENDKIFMLVNRTDNSGSNKDHFSIANLDGSNIKSLIKLDDYVDEYVMGSGLVIFSSYPNDFKDTTTLKVYDNSLSLINTIEIDGFAPDLQIYDKNIFVSHQGETAQSLLIDPMNGDITKIGLTGYSVKVINDGYYLLDMPTEFNTEGFATNYTSKLYSLNDHSEIFTLENQIAYLIKDSYIITSTMTGDRIFSRYSMTGELIDEIKPTNYLSKDLMDMEFVKTRVNPDREYSETDLITMPFRYGNDKVIARILASDSGPFIICDFKAVNCQLIEY